MRIVCFYTKMAPETAASVRAHAPGVEFIETPKDDHFKYPRVMAEIWGSDDLVVIEQDKVLTAETIPSFTECQEPWCSFKYYLMPLKPLWGITNFGLGCTRFSVDAQRAVSAEEFVADNGATWFTCGDCGGRSCWRAMDTRIAHAMNNHGIFVHDHGWVDHLHDEDEQRATIARFQAYADRLRGPGGG